jgi:Ca-activated chloride channel family protein
MSFLAPLGLALGVLIPVLILFYLLKVRRQEFEVGSTYLWQDLLRDLAAHEPWQRFHWSVLLALQLLVVAALVFAVARPFYVAQAEEVVHAVIVLDGGASMQSTDVDPSRFEAAKRQARETVRNLAEGSFGTVILAADQPRVLAPSTTDRSALDRAIEGAQVTYGPADISQALALASSLGPGSASPDGTRARLRVFLFTDGAFGAIAGTEADNLDIRLVQVGNSGQNQGITALSSRADPLNANRYQVFARVRNYADQPYRGTLSLTVDGNLAESRDVTLPPDGDNSAYTILSVGRRSEILLVTSGNVFLEKVLSLLPTGDVSRVAPRRYLSVDVNDYDVVVFDGFSPDVLPRGNSLIIAPSESQLFTIEGEMRRPTIRGWEREDPLLRFVDLRDVAIARSLRITPLPWMRTLIDSENGPLMMAGEQNGQRVILIPFDLRQSNLPLSAAFPILMSNMLGYLEPASQTAQRDLRPGDAVTLAPLPQTEEIVVRQPGGQSQTFPSEGRSLQFTATTQPGLYTVLQRAAGQTLLEEPFSINASDERESDVRPKPVALGSGRTLQAGQAPDLVPVNREIWMWLVPPVLALLLFEWYWFHRRS